MWLVAAAAQVHAQDEPERFTFDALAYHNNGGGFFIQNEASPEAVCDLYASRWWTGPGEGTWLNQIKPGAWYCYKTYEGQVQWSSWTYIIGQCQVHPATLITGAQWSYPHWDTGTANCNCLNSIFDSDVEWCDSSYLVEFKAPDKEDPDDCSKQRKQYGDPVDIGAGNVNETYDDIAGELTLKRYYSSEDSGLQRQTRGLFGRQWSSTYDKKLIAIAEPSNYLPGEARCYHMRTANSDVCFGGNTYPANVPTIYGTVRAVREDGKYITFTLSGGDYQTDANLHYGLTKLVSGSGSLTGWKLNNRRSRTAEYYDAEGRLLSISKAGGLHQVLTYADGAGGYLHTSESGLPDSYVPAVCEIPHPTVFGGIPRGTLLCTTDERGHQLHLQYADDQGNFDFSGKIHKAIGPDGAIFQYRYEVVGTCAPDPKLPCARFNLVEVTMSDGVSQTYRYNERALINDGATCPYTNNAGPGLGHLLSHLTGIYDENGDRRASFLYSCDGTAMGVQEAGGSAYAFAYTSQGENVEITTPLGDIENVALTRLFGVMHVASRSSAARNGCGGNAAAYTYDSNGFVISTTSFDGKVTNYLRDGNGLEISRTEAAGTTEERTIVTEWHTDLRLPKNVTEPDKVTTYTYDSDGNLLSKVVTDRTVAP